MISFVALEVTIHPAFESSGPVAAAKRIVAKDLLAESASAIGAA